MTHKRKESPPQWLVQRYYDYDVGTGELIYRVNAGTRGKRGNRVGTLRKDGYLQASLEGVIYLVHVLVWIHQNGGPIEPGMQLDHVDHDRQHNRMENLRCIPQAHNYRNTSARHNQSGHRGVVWSKRKQRWRAYITTSGKRRWLGMYAKMEDAVSARTNAEKELGFHPNHGLSAKVIAAPKAAQHGEP